MKANQILWALHAFAFASTSATVAPPSDIAQDCSTDSCRQDALEFAFSYGYPLWPFVQLSMPIPNVRTNTLYPNQDMARPGAIGVVRPNADTLYSTLFIDVSAADLVLTVPDMPKDRYWVFPISNPYGDNLANIGSITNHTEGEYLIKYDPINYGVENTPDGPFAGIMYLPSAYGVGMLRIRSSSASEDLNGARRLQAGFQIRERKRCGRPIAPPLDFSLLQDDEFSIGKVSLFELALRLAAKLAPYNQPYIVGDLAWVNNTLRNAGIKDGRFSLPAGTNLTAATSTSNSSVQALLNTPGILIDLGNGWTMRAPRVIGKYGSFYIMRYFLASRGYLALTSEQVLYPSYLSSISLPEGRSAVVEFPSRPKILPGGFWSLTAYDEQGYLIENSQNRYSLGDGNNLTYPDGQPLASGDRGPFQILLQASDVEPPLNWTSNWLPVTSGGGNVTITLRWYGAEKSMGDGSYKHPVINLIDSIQD
ncbi:hypothetical protein F5X68DRAFT_248707 [Plectosphaerella plurivora]|uniref:DUF1254 domain-containing protein n=1 Tax=Plectosphaerella plurivora TaxID=936078 RepID=A0A9P8VLP6_9PEZI|nr:hypothetical protein F5X68DRAFT_248707 [Plectosphaerella plurivora]